MVTCFFSDLKDHFDVIQVESQQMGNILLIVPELLLHKCGIMVPDVQDQVFILCRPNLHK